MTAPLAAFLVWGLLPKHEEYGFDLVPNCVAVETEAATQVERFALREPVDPISPGVEFVLTQADVDDARERACRQTLPLVFCQKLETDRSVGLKLPQREGLPLIKARTTNRTEAPLVEVTNDQSRFSESRLESPLAASRPPHPVVEADAAAKRLGAKEQMARLSFVQCHHYRIPFAFRPRSNDPGGMSSSAT